jgi:hypothetical protein
MVNGRAQAGGEQGINGEWYDGGQFLPSSENTVKGVIQVTIRKGAKKEVAPYVWQPAPADDTASIYACINRFCTDNRRECQFVKGQGFDGFRLEVNDSEIDIDVVLPASHGAIAGMRYLGNGQYENVYRPIKDRNFYNWLCGMAERFNNGERWYSLTDGPNQKEG